MLNQKLLMFCFLLRFGAAQDCDWDLSTDPNQGLAPDSLAAGTRYLGKIQEVPNAESCQAACCEEAGCDLALVGLPADGGMQCLLVSCGPAGCALERSSQFQVFRKKVQESPKGGEKLHVVPLEEAGEPRSNATNSDMCRLPQKTGPCRAAFPRFFYNVTSQSCSSFIYGGCEPNGNNFESQADCEATCSGVTGSVLLEEQTPPPAAAPKAPRMAPLQKTAIPANEFAELCEAPYETGPCRAAMKRWFYNKETGNCQTFIYGGCRGNKNNHMSEESCKSTCTGVSVLPSHKKKPQEYERPADAAELCSLSADTGMCRAAFPKFYYDSDSASCQSFVYGGCGGNANKFDSMEECMTACSGAGRYDGHGKSRSRGTAAFFLFITLAAIAFLLLATLVIMTVRRHRRSRRYSSVSDKRQLISDEQSSQDSLSIPGSPKLGQKA